MPISLPADNSTDWGDEVRAAITAANDLEGTTTASLTTALAGKQPVDSDLTAIAGLTPTNDDIVQRKAGAWTNRTMAQVKTDLALTKSDVGLGSVTNAAQVPLSTVTTKGDLVVATASATVTRLGVGTDGQVLTADSAQTGGVKWADATGGGSGIPASTVDAKGDLIAATANDTVTRLAVGSDGLALVAASGQSTGLQWAAPAPASHNHAASDITSGTVATARLGSGTADSTAFLRGDQTWATPPGATSVTHNTQTGTTYTLVLTDAGKVVEMNNASSNTLTVPPNSSVAFPTGSFLSVRQYGAGQTTIAAGSGVTIRSYGSGLKLAGQYAEATLTKRATDEWVLSGETAV